MRYHQFTSLLITCGVYLLAAPVAYAGDTAKVGGTKGSEKFFGKSCSGTQVLTGLQVNHSSKVIGKVRGVCHNVEAGGKWTDSKQLTQWTPTTHSGNYKNTKQISCPKDHVATGFRARTKSLSTADQVVAVQLRCQKLGNDGQGTGSVQVTDWAGVSGVQTSAISCPSNDPIQTIRGRSGTYMNQLYFSCKAMQYASSQKTYCKLNAYDLYKAAKKKGWKFSCKNSTFMPDPAKKTIGCHGKTSAIVPHGGSGTFFMKPKGYKPACFRSAKEWCLGWERGLYKASKGAEDIGGVNKGPSVSFKFKHKKPMSVFAYRLYSVDLYATGGDCSKAIEKATGQ